MNCAVAAGFGTQTKLHSVGDGATWIADQVEEKFGSQGYYLIDFFHVCEYLADAAKSCVTNDSDDWIEKLKNLLKNNDYKIVLENLKPYVEGDDIQDNNAPVRACYRYLSKLQRSNRKWLTDWLWRNRKRTPLRYSKTVEIA